MFGNMFEKLFIKNYIILSSDVHRNEFMAVDEDEISLSKKKKVANKTDFDSFAITDKDDEDIFNDEEYCDPNILTSEVNNKRCGGNKTKCHWRGKKLFCVCLVSILGLGWAISKIQHYLRRGWWKDSLFVKASDDRLFFAGRWVDIANRKDEVPTKRADWPCSAIRFNVDVKNVGAAIPFFWYGLRSRLRVSISSFGGDPFDEEDNFHQEFKGPAFFDNPITSIITFPNVGNFTITIRKITSSSPYGTGIGNTFMGGSVVDFVGIGQPNNSSDLSILKYKFARKRSRKIVAIGASDTAGWCNGGTTSTKRIDYTAAGWLYEDCGSVYVAQLGDKHYFDVDEISVQAIAGIGIVLNAMSQQKWQLGTLTMPGYFNRTLRTSSQYQWNFSSPSSLPADLVLVSLGGNDFNHQNGHIPSNETFISQYVTFLLFLFDTYDRIPFLENGQKQQKHSDDKGDNYDDKDFDNNNNNSQTFETTIVAVCGMGDPLEATRDPDNNRCRPCSHVKDAIQSFKSLRPNLANRLHYIDIPCDGSVVRGTDDIGCDGHKNSLGQARIAKFLAPQLSAITGWDYNQFN